MAFKFEELAAFGVGAGLANPYTRAFTWRFAWDVGVATAQFGARVGSSAARHAKHLHPALKGWVWFVVAYEAVNFTDHIARGGDLSDYDPVVAGKQAEFLGDPVSSLSPHPFILPHAPFVWVGKQLFG